MFVAGVKDKRQNRFIFGERMAVVCLSPFSGLARYQGSGTRCQRPRMGERIMDHDMDIKEPGSGTWNHRSSWFWPRSWPLELPTATAAARHSLNFLDTVSSCSFQNFPLSSFSKTNMQHFWALTQSKQGHLKTCVRPIIWRLLRLFVVCWNYLPLSDCCDAMS